MGTSSVEIPGTPASSGPLIGLRVTQLSSDIAVASCGRILADLGASVTIGASALRAHEPPNIEFGRIIDAFNNRGKLLSANPLDEPTDLLVMSKREWLELERVLRPRIDAGLVVVVISAFGLTGPRADWTGDDLVSQAYGGGCVRNGEPDREPLRCPAHMGDHEVGLGAAAAALIAVIGARAAGVGQLVDVAAVDSWAALQTGSSILEFIFLGNSDHRDGRRYLGRGYPFTILPCADSEARLICIQGKEWARAIEMMGRPDWAFRERYANRLQNQALYADELDAHVEMWLSKIPGDELLERAIEHRVPWAPIRRVGDVLSWPQLQARGYVRPNAPDEFLVGYPVQFSRTAPLGGGPPADHSEGAGRSPLFGGGVARSSAAAQGESRMALYGIRVLDFSWAWAGGLVGCILADYGADVIKVESRKRLDPMRMDPPMIGDVQDIEQGSLHHNINRGKRSVIVDITRPEGQEIVRRLAHECDVVIENFSPGVLERRGLGYERLSESTPGLIYLALSAVGSSGPFSSLRAYAPVLSALSGVDSMVGYPGEPVIGLQHSLGDPNAAIHGVVAVLAALLERETSGQGQRLDLSQLEALIDLAAPFVIDATSNGRTYDSLGNNDPLALFGGLFACEGEDQWVAVSCTGADDVRRLAAAICATDAVPAEVDLADLEHDLRGWCRTRDKWEIAEALQSIGISAAPMLTIGERFADPHLNERGDFVNAEHPVVGAEVLCGPAWHMSVTPGSVRKAAPLLGADTDDVLRDLVGLSADELGVLRLEGVIE